MLTVELRSLTPSKKKIEGMAAFGRLLSLSECMTLKSTLRFFRLVTLTGACLSCFPLFAATLTVVNTNDSGAGSLREAITTAKSSDTINFNLQLPATIALNSSLSVCNLQNLTIIGPGPSSAQLAISGNNAVQVFNICNGASVTFSEVTIENGNSDAGGAIFNLGTVTLSNSTLSANTAGGGGAIYNAGTLTVLNSTLSRNSAAASGSGGEGGAIANGGSATITNSTLAGNSAQNGGGGIYNQGTLTITNSTLAGNSSTSGGGGIQNGLNTLTLRGALLAGNAPGGNCNWDFGTKPSSLGYNLSDDPTCQDAFLATTDKSNTPALVDPKGLQTNGGPTQTIALLPTSPAVDSIPVSACVDTNGNPVTVDQRGVARPQGTACDIGAYELIQAVPFESFHPALVISTGKKPGFILTSTFTLGSTSAGLNPATEALTLKIANYTLTLPPGSFHQLWNAPNAPYAYEGTVNGATVVLGILSLGNRTFAFDALGSPVTFPGITNPVSVTLTYGSDTGTSSVKALITH